MMASRATLQLLASTGMITSLALAQSSAVVQNEGTATGKNLSEMTWTKAGTYEWDRPDNVRFVLVRACGGGGGGAGGYSLDPKPAPNESTAAGGGGGAGSSLTTILLGPLVAERYTIVIGPGGAGGGSARAKSTSGKGRGGAPGEAGSATLFTGPEISFRTPGAGGGEPARLQTRVGGYLSEFYVGRVSYSIGAYRGGGAAQDGEPGLLGLGGLGSVRGDSGGGGGSIGNGGAGGSIDSSGADGGACAGGGGAGYLLGDRTTSHGGRGGDGTLTLLPISVAAAHREGE